MQVPRKNFNYMRVTRTGFQNVCRFLRQTILHCVWFLTELKLKDISLFHIIKHHAELELAGAGSAGRGR